jgi:hypothetical protein
VSASPTPVVAVLEAALPPGKSNRASECTQKREIAAWPRFPWEQAISRVRRGCERSPPSSSRPIREADLTNPYPDLRSWWNSADRQWHWEVEAIDAIPVVAKAIDLAKPFQPATGPMPPATVTETEAGSVPKS